MSGEIIVIAAVVVAAVGYAAFKIITTFKKKDKPSCSGCSCSSGGSHKSCCH